MTPSHAAILRMTSALSGSRMSVPCQAVTVRPARVSRSAAISSGVAQLAGDLVGVLPERRHRVRALRHLREVERMRQRPERPDRAVQRPASARAPRAGGAPPGRPRRSGSRTARQPRQGAPRRSSGPTAPGSPRSAAPASARFFSRELVGPEAGIVHQVRPRQHALAEAPPLALVLDRQVHVLAVAAAVRAVRHDDVVPPAGPLQLDPPYIQNEAGALIHSARQSSITVSMVRPWPVRSRS